MAECKRKLRKHKPIKQGTQAQLPVRLGQLLPPSSSAPTQIVLMREAPALCFHSDYTEATKHNQTGPMPSPQQQLQGLRQDQPCHSPGSSHKHHKLDHDGAYEQ